MAKAETNDEKIDQKTVNIILKRIIMAEKSNLHTKQKSESQLIQELKNIIEDEVNAYKKN